MIIVAPRHAMAVDEVIPSGETRTVTQTISGVGDTLTVEEGGAIDTTGSAGDGVDATADDQTVTNNGDIDANGTGIRAQGNNALVINNGRINAMTIQIGIRTDGDYAIIENNGSINADSYGIRSEGAHAKITNTGRIDSINHGIRSDGDYAYVVNHGTVDGDSEGIVVDIHAIRSGGEFSTVINHGTLLANEDGIFSIGDNALIINRGTIIPGAWGMGSQGDNSVVINEGTILAGDAVGAINLVGINDELILRPGSVLEGLVGFYGINETFTLDPGLNLFLQYDGEFSTLNTAMPVVHDTANKVIYTIDPTGFALAQSFIQTTADAVHEAVRSGAGRVDMFGGFDGASGFSYGSGTQDVGGAMPSGWVSGYGGYQSQNGKGAVTGGKQAYGGLVTGGGFTSGERHHGAFLGGSYSRLETDNDTQTIEAAAIHGGLYAGARHGPYWIDSALLVGYSDFQSDRTVANNAVAGGLETASADYGGYFISPSLTAGRPVGERTEISLGGHYAGLFLDGHSETGSAANLTVASRAVHVAAIRAKATYLAHRHTADSGMVSVETWAGIDGVFNFGDDVEASVAAGAFNAFPATFTDTAAIGFAGIGISHAPTAGSWSFDASLEGRYGTDAYSEIRAAATAAIRF